MNGLLWTLFGISALVIFVFEILIARQISIAHELSHHGVIITFLTLLLCTLLVIGGGILLFLALSL